MPKSVLHYDVDKDLTSVWYWNECSHSEPVFEANTHCYFRMKGDIYSLSPIAEFSLSSLTTNSFAVAQHFLSSHRLRFLKLKFQLNVAP